MNHSHRHPGDPSKGVHAVNLSGAFNSARPILTLKSICFPASVTAVTEAGKQIDFKVKIGLAELKAPDKFTACTPLDGSPG